MRLTNKIGLGSVQFGIAYGVSNTIGQTSDSEVNQILELAKKHEINCIDTASAYGTAEEVLGSKDLSKFDVVSKFMPSEIDGSLINQLNISLEKLKLNSLYGYLSHRPLSLLENPNDWNDLVDLKQEGKVKKIGFSLNEPFELEILLENGFVPDLIQVPYNYFDTRFKNQLIALKANGCEIHTRSVFLQGLFFTNVSKLPDFFEEVKSEIMELQNKYNEKLPAALLRFVLQSDFIDKVIIGVENSKQLETNIESISLDVILPTKSFNFPKELVMPSLWPKK